MSENNKVIIMVTIAVVLSILSIIGGSIYYFFFRDEETEDDKVVASRIATSSASHTSTSVPVTVLSSPAASYSSSSPASSPSPNPPTIESLIEKDGYVMIRHVAEDRCLTLHNDASANEGTDLTFATCSAIDDLQQWKIGNNKRNNMSGYHSIRPKTGINADLCIDYDGNNYELRKCDQQPHDHRDFKFEEASESDYAGVPRKYAGTLLRIRTGKDGGDSGCMDIVKHDNSGKNDPDCTVFNYEIGEATDVIY